MGVPRRQLQITKVPIENPMLMADIEQKTDKQGGVQGDPGSEEQGGHRYFRSD